MSQQSFVGSSKGPHKLWVFPLLSVLLLFTPPETHASCTPDSAPHLRRLLQATTASVNIATNPSNFLYPNTPALFAFGDGDYDVGNVALLGRDNSTGSYPYGSSFYNITGRESDGRIIVDFFAGALGLHFLKPSLDVNASFYQGISFATPSSGRFNFTTDADGYQGTPLLKQVDQFVQFQQNAVAYWTRIGNGSIPTSPKYPRPEFFKQGIYTAHSGGNDLLFFSVNNYTQSERPEYLQNMTNIYESWARAIYNAGGRKFVLMNFGQFGCTPAAILRNRGNCSALITADCFTLANQTNYLAQKLQAQLSDATFIVGDAYTFNIDIAKNPAQFGITRWNQSCCGGGTPELGNTQVQCNRLTSQIASNATGRVTNATFPVTICPNPSEYLYWDQVHLTEAANRYLANDIFGGSTYVFPQNMVQAFILPQLLRVGR